MSDVIGTAIIGPSFVIGEEEASTGGNATAQIKTEKPPLGLHAELVFPNGTTTRWDSDAVDARNQPTGISFKTSRYNGFTDCNLTLNRRIDQDYPDLGLLEGLNLIGYDASVAYEGWVAALPRSLQTTPQIGVQAQGWMAHAKDQTFIECYVDRDLSKWRQMGIALNAGQITSKFAPSSMSVANDQSFQPALIATVTGPWGTEGMPDVEAWWGQPGVTIGSIYAAWSKTSTILSADTNWKWRVDLADNDAAGGLQEGAELRSPGPNVTTTTATTATRAYGRIVLAYTTSSASTSAFTVYWSKVAVYGTHGLTKHGEEPGGFYVSDIIRNIANR